MCLLGIFLVAFGVVSHGDVVSDIRLRIFPTILLFGIFQLILLFFLYSTILLFCFYSAIPLFCFYSTILLLVSCSLTMAVRLGLIIVKIIILLKAIIFILIFIPLRLFIILVGSIIRMIIEPVIRHRVSRIVIIRFLFRVVCLTHPVPAPR